MDAIDIITAERDGQTYCIAIYQDADAPNPLEDWDGMGMILSLNRRHVNFDQKGIDAAFNDPDSVPLSYFEHGRCLWSVAGELPAACRCPWDSVNVAGLWLPDASTLEAARNYAGSTRRHFIRKRAREACGVYSQWCNGEVFGYQITRVSARPDGGFAPTEALDSCSGFYGLDECLKAATSALAA